MAIQFPALPYAPDALEPRISKNTIDFHYGKHHRHYVTELNELIKKTPFDKMELEDIILESFQENEKIFNNAAQAWNHNFYWHCMDPKSSGEPDDNSMVALLQAFGSLENFKAKFMDSAQSLFGSGWTWLVKNPNGKLSIQNMKDADTPIVHEQTPLFTCDVWEHAYYLDYQNERPKYLENFWKVVNWNFIEDNLQAESVTRVDKNKNRTKSAVRAK